MKLYTLRLGAPLSWTTVTNTVGIALPAPSKEGSEAIFTWARDQLVDDSDNGPHILCPLPPPLQRGCSEDPSDTSSQPGKLILPAGSYLFCQGRLNNPKAIEQTLEWFFREVWWIRAKYRGPVYLRLIREDGKTAVQVIMESAEEV